MRGEGLVSQDRVHTETAFKADEDEKMYKRITCRRACVTIVKDSEGEWSESMTRRNVSMHTLTMTIIHPAHTTARGTPRYALAADNPCITRVLMQPRHVTAPRAARFGDGRVLLLADGPGRRLRHAPHARPRLQVCDSARLSACSYKQAPHVVFPVSGARLSHRH